MVSVVQLGGSMRAGPQDCHAVLTSRQTLFYIPGRDPLKLTSADRELLALFLIIASIGDTSETEREREKERERDQLRVV